MPAGRPVEYNDELLAKAATYLASCQDEVRVVGTDKPVVVRTVNLPGIESFALYIGISRETVYDWETKYDEFSDIVRDIRQEQAKRLLNKGLSGEYNPTIAKLILSGKHGYVEKTATDLTTKGESINVEPDPKLAAEFTAFMKERK